ncbi:hypothetical protein [Nonomuraea antimicrobica]|uniref:hypothetical protein n=1 Tax=Nonomuraea antimicrobica TaxID=561173 RepID=UPI0031E72343
MAVEYAVANPETLCSAEVEVIMMIEPLPLSSMSGRTRRAPSMGTGSSSSNAAA